MNLYRHLARAVFKHRKPDSHLDSKTLSQAQELDNLQGNPRDEEKYKSEIERHIVETIISGLNQGHIKEPQLQEIASFVLERIDQVSNRDHMIGFLHQLALEWPVFEHLAIHEEAKIKKEEGSKAAQNILTLIKEDQIADTDHLASTYINIK